MVDEIEPEENYDYKTIRSYNNYLRENNEPQYKFSDIDFNNNNKYNMLSRTKDILNKNFLQNKENYCDCNCRQDNVAINYDDKIDEPEKIEKIPSLYYEPYNPDEYEENQFNEFLKDLMLVESDLEKIKSIPSLMSRF